MAAAENEAVPDTAPDRISEHAILIGRIIFQKNVTPAEEVSTVFTTFMVSTGVIDHDGIGNIQPDDHHTATVSGDIDHDATVNFEAGEHLTVGAINHNVLANLNAGTVFKHITADQLAALHAEFTAANAITAVEGKDPLDFAGDTTHADDKKSQFGTDNDASIRHNDTDFIIVNSKGNLSLQTPGVILLDTTNDIRYRDVGDGFVTVYNFDMDARTMVVGATADRIASTFHGSIKMTGTTTADEALQLPYLTAAPSTLVNGMMWMESDGLHIYYNGAEKLVAGV